MIDDFLKTASGVEPPTREEALAMQGTGWDGDLDQMRGGSQAATGA